ncbi:protein of unknown function [Shewanella benthica]|uniref:Uncharacterized protein n=1 Tax=Shewanella benthica TaxID=43661 RepID=A0A330LY89_9GAMM|nr:protein of unknown function [Shewanella benthica]
MKADSFRRIIPPNKSHSIAFPAIGDNYLHVQAPSFTIQWRSGISTSMYKKRTSKGAFHHNCVAGDDNS